MRKKSTKKNSGCPTTLLEEYLHAYFAKRPDAMEYETYINEQMEAFEEREQQRLKEMERLAEEPDEDGFVTVINKRSHAQLGTEAFDDGLETTKPKLKASKALPNFYQFNSANEKKNKLEELRLKFEEDRRRIQELRNSKLFQ